MNIAKKLYRYIVGGIPEKQESVYPLQHFPGYVNEDLSVFTPFQNIKAKAEPDFIVDFLGVRTRSTSLANCQREFSGKLLGIPVPGDYHAEAIEYIGLLKSVLAAKNQYYVMELGAGWGPWLINGAAAARHLGIKNIKMLGVETDSGHVESMKQHFLDNGFNPSEHELIKAAVGAQKGKAIFPKIADSANQWGARPAKLTNDKIDSSDSNYLGALLNLEHEEVDVVPINELLEKHHIWDLVHIDVQGWEAQLCSVAMQNLNNRARYVIIGTHSRKLDGEILGLFHSAGWILENEKPTKFQYRHGTNELEGMTLADGTQVWRNPKL